MQIKEFYKERASWRNSREEDARFKKVARLAKPSDDALVLDIGCRDGHLKNHLPQNAIYRGIDIVEDFKAENIKIEDITQGISFDKNFFDFVFCVDVLEHLKNPFFVLREINRVLKPSGILILSVPNPYHFKEILWNLFRVKDRQGHIFSWTKQTMQKLAEFCGFKLLKTSGTYLIPLIGCSNMMTRSIVYKFQANGEGIR